MNKGVTYLGTCAFTNCTNLTSVSLPTGLQELGADVFMGCSKLTSVTIPGSVTSIGRAAFGMCSVLTDDEVKQKIREIADDNDVSLTETEISQILTLARTLEGLDVEQLRARAYGLADATRKATGWKKFTEGAKQTLEDIGTFSKDVAQFLRDLFSKWFGGNNADTEPAK